MVTFLPEYSAAPHEQMQLHLLVTVVPWSSRDLLIKRLRGAEFCQELVHDDLQQLIVVRAAPGADIDRVLQQAVTMLRIFNQSHWQAETEIVEARLCPDSHAMPSCTEPVILSDRFVVCASRNDEVKGKECLVLESGRAFGSGGHPSTRLAVKCLEHLAAHAFVFPPYGLDLGCGSGILSFVALSLGAVSMLGIDISREAVASAVRNATLNGFDMAASFQQMHACEIDDAFSLIVANLSPSVLMQLIPVMRRLSELQGFVVLAGLQKGQSASLCCLMDAEGFVGPLATFSDGPWRAHLFSRPAPVNI